MEDASSPSCNSLERYMDIYFARLSPEAEAEEALLIAALDQAANEIDFDR